jgi:medium-chain acyl-[acyl-carrier-protein] hydrolase
LGAFVAFELARSLRNDGLPDPCQLFIAGQRAPHLPDPDPQLQHLPDKDFIREVCRRYDGIPAHVLESPELLQLLLVPLRADFTMSENYTYSGDRPLDCPITVLGGLKDHSTTQGHLTAWGEHTTGSFALRMFAGDHFFIEQDCRGVVEFLAAILEHYATADLTSLGHRTA